MTLYIELEHRNANGAVISIEKRQARSYLRNWLGWVCTIFRESVISNWIKDTSGNYVTTQLWYTDDSNNSYTRYTSAHVTAGVADDTFGIQVGSGNTTPAPTDYALGSKITHGTSSGNLSYGAHTVEAPQTSGSDTTFRIIRTFTNNTSATVTVREIGLVVYLHMVNYGASVNTDKKVMMIRDVLSVAKDIAVGETLTVRYIPKVTT